MSIIRERLEFVADDAALTGNLYRPASAGRVPGVVVGGTWTSVKEQMADRYAEQLAERGLAALSFDFAGFGESGGEPRDVESPARKIRDIRRAVDFLAEHPVVDPDRIGALGICAAAMYMSAAAADDERIGALALVAPWLHDRAVCEEAYGGAEAVDAKIAVGRTSRERYEATGGIEYVSVVSATDPAAALPFAIDFYRDPERGGVPQWPNRFAVMAWEEWLSFDALAYAPRIEQPTLLVHSDEAAIPDGARRFAANLAGPADFLWTRGEQFDFYDQPPQVAIAADTAAAHFHRVFAVSPV